MKRLALLVASVAALVLFTACPDKPIDEFDEFEEETTDGYYIEEIEESFSDPLFDTIFIYNYRQFFKKVGNDLIYDPCLDSNIEFGWIDFERYCKYETIPILHITGDSIIYDLKHYGVSEININPVAKIHFESGYFVFYYTINQNISCVHKCRRIASLSN